MLNEHLAVRFRIRFCTGVVHDEGLGERLQKNVVCQGTLLENWHFLTMSKLCCLSSQGKKQDCLHLVAFLPSLGVSCHRTPAVLHGNLPASMEAAPLPRPRHWSIVAGPHLTLEAQAMPHSKQRYLHSWCALRALALCTFVCVPRVPIRGARMTMAVAYSIDTTQTKQKKCLQFLLPGCRAVSIRPDHAGQSGFPLLTCGTPSAATYKPFN